eukprot:c21144_g1_i1 orf=364-2055(+)
MTVLRAQALLQGSVYLDFKHRQREIMDGLPSRFLPKDYRLWRTVKISKTDVEQTRKSMVIAAALSPPRFPEITDRGNGNDSFESSSGDKASFERETLVHAEKPEALEIEDQKFVWKDHWYPVSLIEDLDPKLPIPFELLGIELVLWRDGEGKWRAFSNKCPHRLAPLSEGRIDEDGWLQCSYHGWSFKPDGQCGRIPQAAPDGPEAKAISSPRACASTFPTLVSQGMLFVWPDEKGWKKAYKMEPPKLPSVFNDCRYSTVTIQRDLFYGYDTLMENVSDPSHIDFAHHKVTGRRDRAKSLPFKVVSSGAWGYKGGSDSPKIYSEFLAPSYVINKIEIPAKLPIVGEKSWEIWICSFNIPMAPGKTRSIVCSARNFFRFLMPGSEWWQLVPRWHEHWTSNKVYDGDMIVLQGQEKVFLASSSDASDINKKYTKLTFTPTQADRFVLAFRSWLRHFGSGQPDWAPGSNVGPLPSTVLTKHQMLDRYEQHTLKCSSCKNAYESFKALHTILLGATVVLVACAGVPSDMRLRVMLAIGSLTCAAVSFILKQLEKNFVFVDYIHAKID